MKESVIAFGAEGQLVGTVCLPGNAVSSASVGVVLFNAGLVHRVGPHRINVRLARRLASAGIPSIRFDLSGQGDSLRASGAESFESQAVTDLSAAMDALGKSAGIGRFSLFGFCSGGCHGFAAAQVDKRVAGVILYDTYIYRNLRSRINRYLLSIRQRGFRAAAEGWVSRRFAAMALGRADESDPMDEAGADFGMFTTPSREQFAAIARALADRGSRVGVMYSGAFEDYNYADQFRDTFRTLGLADSVSCDFFPELGHSATVLAGQVALIDRIVEWNRELDERMRREARAP